MLMCIVIIIVRRLRKFLIYNYSIIIRIGLVAVLTACSCSSDCMWHQIDDFITITTGVYEVHLEIRRLNAAFLAQNQ